ncbi:GTP-binding protein [Diaphorobacter sp. NR2-3-3-1]|nr:GTP-binding protein [Diaphorobacter caeni]MBF5003163.1 GTP-binding protein [Diaphorobacter caeni]
MVVVGGYLGSGKTTLLNRLLGNTEGQRVAVLVNDFGEINVDAALIRSRSSDVIQLENGCVCCSIGDRLVQALAAVGERVQRPDLLVIEASGVSDPTRIAQVGMLDADFRLNAVVVTVDVSNIESHLRDPMIGDMLRRQIAGATALVLTKCDLVGAQDVEEAAEWLAEIAPRAAQFRAEMGCIPSSVFFDEAPRVARPFGHDGGGWKRRGSDALLHDAISSFFHRTTRRFHKQRLRQVLRELPAGTLRAKGLVHVLEKSSAQEFHVVADRVRIADAAASAVHPADAIAVADAVDAVESVLVFIGCFAPGDEALVRARLDGALAA